jgi:predicted nucleic acid-binding protein
VTAAYFDSSALVKLLIRERGSAEAWENWLAATPPVCCRLGFVEARAALAAARRTGRLDEALHRTGKRLLNELWEEVAPVEADEALVVLAADLAEKHALRGYDAVHVAAALAAATPLFVSADADQLRAAHAENLAVLDPAATA